MRSFPALWFCIALFVEMIENTLYVTLSFANTIIMMVLLGYIDSVIT